MYIYIYILIIYIHDMCCCHPLVYRTKLGFKWIQGRDCGKPWNSPGTQHVNLEIAFSGKTTYFFFNGPQWLAFFGWQWHNHQQLNMAGLCDIDILIWWRPPQEVMVKVVPGCLWLQDQLQETLHGVEDLELAQEVRKFIVLWLRTDTFFVGLEDWLGGEDWPN